MTRASVLEQHVRTLPKSRPLRWHIIDLYLRHGVRAAQRSPLRWWERGVVHGILVTAASIAFLGPLVAGATLAGGRHGPFPASFSVPFAAVFMVLGAATAALSLFEVARDPWQRTHSTAILTLFGSTCGVVVFLLALWRASTDPMDPAVAQVCFVVIACAGLALWVLAVFQLRLPATQIAALFDEVRRSQPAIWSAAVADLENALAILIERERITPEQAERARTLGPGRLAEMDAAASKRSGR